MTPLACVPGAIPPESRPRYVELRAKLLAAISQSIDLPTGRAWLLSEPAVTLPETAEWVAMERLCCPFLTLQLETTGTEPGHRITITGPAGTREFLDAEFGS